MNKRYLRIHDLSIAIHESDGQDHPAMFFLHGNSQAGSVFAHQFHGTLGQRFRIVAMDLPGHGDSSPAADPDTTYTLPGYTTVIQDVARHLALGPTIFVGHSLGGHLLIQATPSLPSLTGLLVFGTPPLQHPPRLDQAFLPHPATALILQESLSEIEAELWAKAQTRHPLPRQTDHLRDLMRHTDPRCRSRLGQSLQRDPWQDECLLLQRLNVPFAIVLGEQDPFINHSYCHALPLPGLWKGKIQIMEGCGHAPHMEAPARFDALLMAFMETCTQANHP
ncbi:MAG: alpha/beta hydrolase [Magnetococcales bacterium]|nr:alpha/beta hydrolase [Magnetococcales bacterium]